VRWTLEQLVARFVTPRVAALRREFDAAQPVWLRVYASIADLAAAAAAACGDVEATPCRVSERRCTFARLLKLAPRCAPRAMPATYADPDDAPVGYVALAYADAAYANRIAVAFVLPALLVAPGRHSTASYGFALDCAALDVAPARTAAQMTVVLRALVPRVWLPPPATHTVREWCFDLADPRAPLLIGRSAPCLGVPRRERELRAICEHWPPETVSSLSRTHHLVATRAWLVGAVCSDSLCRARWFEGAPAGAAGAPGAAMDSARCEA
jgi:hypothetical protein